MTLVLWLFCTTLHTAPRISFLKHASGTSLAVQRLGLHAFTAGGESLIPGQGTKISHDAKITPHIHTSYPFTLLLQILDCLQFFFPSRLFEELGLRVSRHKSPFTISFETVYLQILHVRQGNILRETFGSQPRCTELISQEG